MKEIFLSSLNLLGRKETWEIIFLSFRVSVIATFFSFIFGLIISLFILNNKKRREDFLYLCQSFLFTPSVALGLVLYLILSKKGFLGFLNLLYTPNAIILGQCILILPLIIVFLVNGMKEVADRIRDELLTLGANSFQYNFGIIKEGKFYLISAFIVGLSRAVGETGLAMVVGGNIKGETRVATTAIALYTMKGEFEIALSLALILFIIAFVFNFSLRIAERKWKYI